MFSLNKATVHRGQACELAVFMIDSLSEQISVVGLTAVVMAVQNQDGTFVEKAASGGTTFGLGGDKTTLYVFPFTAVEVSLFKLGPARSIFVKVTYGSDTVMKYEFKKFLTVLPEPYA